MEIEVLEGQQVIKFEGVTNLEQLLEVYTSYAEQYKGLVVVEGEEKNYKNIVEDLKEKRTPLTKVRATMNKQFKAITKTELEKMDKVITVLTNVINPIENGLEVFAEEKRQAKLNKKLDKFMPLIDELNNVISQVDLPHFELNGIEWNDKWNNKKDTDIDMLISKLTDETINKIKAAKNARATAELIAEKVENEYDLKGKINLEVLKGDIYLDVSELTEKIEGLAMKQQELEIEIEEKIQAEIKEKQIKEEKKRKIEEEIKEKLRIEEQKKQLEIEREKIRVEELEKIKKEEALKKYEAEKVEIEIEDKQEKIVDVVTISKIKEETLSPAKKYYAELKKPVKTKTIKITFPALSKEKAHLLIKFLENNQIEYTKE